MFKEIRATPFRDWRAVPVFSVLTYPYDCRPRSAEEAHRDLAAFRRRWGRSSWGKALGGHPRAFWNMEFTARGAVHWNLLLLVAGEHLSAHRLKQLRVTIREAWSGVVNGRCGHDHQVRTSVDKRSAKSMAAYFAGYTTKAGGKEYQRQVPEDWDHSGRWWGRWCLDPAPGWKVPTALQRSEWHQLRRVLRGHQAARVRARSGKRLRRRSGTRIHEIERPPGLWAASRDEGGWLEPLAKFGVLLSYPEQSCSRG